MIKIKSLADFGEKRIYYFFLFIYFFLGLFIIILSLNIDYFRFLTIKSNSMRPTLSTGSLVLIKKQNDYQPGDIISFYAQNNGKEEIITHRLIKIGGNVYITRGDSNLAIDPYVRPRLIIGKVILSLPYLGFIYILAKTPPGIFILIIFPAMFFVVVEILKIYLLFNSS